MEFLVQHIEALIFCSPKPIALNELAQCLSEMFDAKVPKEDISQAIDTLITKYKADNYSFEIIESGGGFQFLTKAAYQASISILLKQQSKKKLSNSAMETMAIIAYKQPITKSEMEQIRGVNCDYAVQKLLEKELVEIKGKSESIGRPLLYGTSNKFMDYFGINDLKNLPTLKDLKQEQEDQTIGDEQES